ncbi:MAG: glycosyltransferase family 2 protein [Microthrixaceae bacterium]
MTGDMPGWEAVVFTIAFIVIVVNLVWNLWLFVWSRRYTAGGPDTSADESEFTWIFLVPALNEEVTIADSVERLLSVRCTKRHIVVVDDGSTDSTPQVLAGISHPELTVIRREPPDAQLGKADVLNDAWSRLSSALPDLDRSRTIVCVVDADGRLSADAPSHVADWFADPEVGGAQVRVRIYNRHHPLTWAQDVEFGVYGMLYQAGRASLGTAGMGGNGQFNRLSALDDLAQRDRVSADGPWHDKLTEDQDLGLRLLEAGWRCGHDNRTQVDQQGLSNVRRLFRQRVRWAQGNLQAMRHIRRIPHMAFSRRARTDLFLYLMQPVMLAIVGIAVLAALVAWALREVDFLPDHLWTIAVFYVFGFGGVILGCIRRTGTGPKAWLWGWVVAMVYAAYTWMLFPVMFGALYRMIRSRTAWAKTDREPITESATEPSVA